MSWPKNKPVDKNPTKTETKNQKEEKIKKLKSQLSQIKNELNKSENSTKKDKYSTQLTEIENKLKNLSQQNDQEQTIQELEQNIKTINQELKIPEKTDDPKPKPDKPTKNPKTPEDDDNNKSPDDTPEDKKPSKPDPQPENNGWKYIATKINDNTYKYHITFEGGEIDFSDFITLLKGKNKAFFKAFQGALKDANSKFPAYFWKCPPISKNTLDKVFEFVVIKSEEVNNLKQNWTSFGEHISPNHQKWAFNFPGYSGSTLVIPIPKPGPELDFKNISQFTKNAPEEQQQELWKLVAEKMSEELEENDAVRWLNTEGTGVPYLHVRIDKTNKFYSNYPEYC